MTNEDRQLELAKRALHEHQALQELVRSIVRFLSAEPFVRIYSGPMMDFTTFCTLKNAIQPKTWKKINELLTGGAVEQERISGEKLRIDTTAYETNIHWPTDSSLLWDTYRVLCRLVNTAREIDPEVASDRPVDHTLVDSVLEIHRKIFGENPEEFSADKGFYESMEKIEKLEAEIEIVSIGKKGSRTEEETERETSERFRISASRRSSALESRVPFLF